MSLGSYIATALSPKTPKEQERLAKAIEYTGRPQQALYGMLSAGGGSNNPVAMRAAMQGLLGEETFDTSDFIPTLSPEQKAVLTATGFGGLKEAEEALHLGVDLTLDPLNLVPAGSVARLGTKAGLTDIYSGVSNFLDGFYSGNKPKAYATLAKDAVASIRSGMTETAREVFDKTGYSKQMINLAKRLADDYRKAPKGSSQSVNLRKQLEAQLEHGVYMMGRMGFKAEDMPPLYQNILKKMSTRGSGFQELSEENYMATIKNLEKTSRLRDKPVVTDPNVSRRLYNEAVEAQGFQNADDAILVVRSPDGNNPFVYDATNSKAVNLFTSLFKSQKEKTGRETFANKNKLFEAFEEHIENPRVKKLMDENRIKITGKDDGGIYFEIAGKSKKTAKELSEKNKAAIKSNLKSLKERYKAGEITKEFYDRRVKQLKETSPHVGSGIVSTSFLEGGVNMRGFINRKGEMTFVISDNYDFLEKSIPAIENSIDKRLLGITQPITIDLNLIGSNVKGKSGQFSNTTGEQAFGRSGISDEMARQVDEAYGEVQRAQTTKGMLTDMANEAVLTQKALDTEERDQ